MPNVPTDVIQHLAWSTIGVDFVFFSPSKQFYLYDKIDHKLLLQVQKECFIYHEKVPQQIRTVILDHNHYRRLIQSHK